MSFSVKYLHYQRLKIFGDFFKSHPYFSVIVGVIINSVQLESGIAVEELSNESGLCSILFVIMSFFNIFILILRDKIFLM